MESVGLPELLTLRQAANLLSVHPNTLRNWEREGRISAVRIGSRRDRRFSVVTLRQILEPNPPAVLTQSGF